jgi:hypothetical protein
VILACTPVQVANLSEDFGRKLRYVGIDFDVFVEALDQIL